MSIQIFNDNSTQIINQTLQYNNSTTFKDDGKCEMFGSFGYIIQGVLGVLSFMILVIKRFKESPKRPWKIWFFDVSKQIVSAAIAHLLNVLLAVFLSLDNNTDSCVWYFVNILVDTTIGVCICFLFMKIIDKIAKRNDWRTIQSGLYYVIYEINGKKKTKLKYKMYFTQLLVWVSVVIFSKVILLGLQKIFTDILQAFGNTLLSPFKANGKLKLLTAMVFFPLIFNSINFWLVDNILKLKTDEEGNESIRELYIKETGEINEIRSANKANKVEISNKGHHHRGPSIEIQFDVSDKTNNSHKLDSNRIYAVTGNGDMSGINLAEASHVEKNI